MKVKFSNDLHGRMIRCQNRAKMIGTTLQAIAHSDLEDPDRDSLQELGEVAIELAEELDKWWAAYGDGGAR